MDDTSRQIGELRDEMRVGFKEIRSEFKDIRSEFKEMRSELKDVRVEAHSEVRDLRVEINTRFDAVQASITMIWVSMIGGMVALVAALLATRL